MIPESRDEVIGSLQSEEFDLLVIGGGIFGAVTVWQAQKRGLKAALIESHDYGHGSSANSYKIIHGGIRYLQHLDIPRILASCRERSAFLRMAPHLCLPLPILIPTYGWGKLGMPFLGVGCLLYDLITVTRNWKIPDPARKLPFTRFLSKQSVLAEFPHLVEQGLTGACVFNDGRFYNPTRLVWSFCDSARLDGANCCNYIKAEKLSIENGAVVGIRAQDRLSGTEFNIRSKCVVNTTGPWAERWLSDVLVDSAGDTEPSSTESRVYSRDACFVVDKIGNSRYTLALQGETSDPDAVVARTKRHLFMSPWREYSLIGVWHKVTSVHPEKITVEPDEIKEFVSEINNSFPALNLNTKDVRLCNAGLVPFGDEQKDEKDLSYGKRSSLVDHDAFDGLKNLITLIGLRYTMARGEGVKVLDLVQRKLGLMVSGHKTQYEKLHSAQFERFDQLVADIQGSLKNELPENICTALAHNHGSNAEVIVERMNAKPELGRVYSGTTVTAAEVQHVCELEQVESLADVVLRRTDIASAGNPGVHVLQEVLAEVALIKGWDEVRQRKEIAELENLLARMLAM